MVYLIGVDHKVQYTNDHMDILLVKSFAQYLKGQAKQLKVTLIAEEFNQEAICKSKAKACTARDVAKKLGIEHRFCDPDSTERASIGIPSEKEIKEQLGLGVCLTHDEFELLEKEEEKYFPQREQFWFEKIEDKINNDLIFICGNKHIKSFQKLLIEKGCKVKNLSEGWGN